MTDERRGKAPPEQTDHGALWSSSRILGSADAASQLLTYTKGLSHADFAYRIGDKLGKYAPAGCWVGPIRLPARSSQFKTRLTVPALSSRSRETPATASPACGLSKAIRFAAE